MITTCKLRDDVSVLVRPMTNQQADRFDDLRQFKDRKHLATAYALGCCLLEDDQSPVFTQDIDETDISFATRVLNECPMTGADVLTFIQHLDLVENTMRGVIRRDRQSRD